MRATHRLTARGIVGLLLSKQAYDGGFGRLIARAGGQWVLCLTVHGQRSEMGLGRRPPCVAILQSKFEVEWGYGFTYSNGYILLLR